MRLAEIAAGVVVNVIEVRRDAVPAWCADWPETDEAGPGWAYADGVFTAPPEPEAEPVEG